MMDTIRVVVVYASKYGHTKLQAEAVARGATAVEGVELTLLSAAEAVDRLAEFDQADAIIFGSATYMGSLAAEMKLFFEAAVSRWVSRAWQDKIAGGFTCSSNFSGDKSNTMNSLLINAMQQGMIWVSLNQLPGSDDPAGQQCPEGPGPDCLNRNSGSIGPMASCFRLKTLTRGDVRTAEAYGTRVAEITRRFHRGK